MEWLFYLATKVGLERWRLALSVGNLLCSVGAFSVRWGLAPTFGINMRLLSGWTKAHPYERIALAVVRADEPALFPLATDASV
jgi:hypothetical protein